MNNKILPALILLTSLAACGDRATSEPAVEAAAPEPAPTMPERTASAVEATVFFVSPADGETVSNPVSIVFGIDGMTVAPAGQDIPRSGHHHLLIDTGLPDLGLPIPKDENHIHFGDGSTVTEITLEPGEHTLQILFSRFAGLVHLPEPISVLIIVAASFYIPVYLYKGMRLVYDQGHFVTFLKYITLVFAYLAGATFTMMGALLVALVAV